MEVWAIILTFYLLGRVLVFGLPNKNKELVKFDGWIYNWLDMWLTGYVSGWICGWLDMWLPEYVAG